MSFKIIHTLCEVLLDPIVWYVPELHRAILRAGCNLIIIERVPSQVQHKVLVSRHFGIVDIKSANLQVNSIITCL